VTVAGTGSFNKFIALIPTGERAVGIARDEVEFSAFCSDNSSTFLNYDLQKINTRWTDKRWCYLAVNFFGNVEAYLLHGEAYPPHYEAYLLHGEAHLLHGEAYPPHYETYLLHGEAYLLHGEAYLLHCEVYLLHGEAYYFAAKRTYFMMKRTYFTVKCAFFTVPFTADKFCFY